MDNRSHKARLAEVAARQWGRVAWRQFAQLGIDRKLVNRWLCEGYVYRVLPRVYAVGHCGPSVEGDLCAALLYAGPGAALSHATAAWWLGLLDEQPRQIHVSTPRQCRSLPGIAVHGRRRLQRLTHKRLPTTALPQILLDVAASAPLRTVRKALASADYQGRLELAAVEAVLESGSRGRARLRSALAAHQPQLARTRSELESLFLEICEQARIPPPLVNAKVDGWEVDMLWPDARLAVELDGYANHRSPAQVNRDRRKELALRAAELSVVRYSAEQLLRDRAGVIEDLAAARTRRT